MNYYSALRLLLLSLTANAICNSASSQAIFNWYQLPTNTNPSVCTPRLVSDSLGNNVWLCGGDGTSVQLWRWSGVDWVFQPAQNPPPHRQHFAVAYDEHRSKLVLFGGYVTINNCNLYYGSCPNETWEFDGSVWVPRPTSVLPPTGLYGPQMAYDSLRQKVVLVTQGSQTWEWDGTAWQAKGAVPSLVTSETYKGRLVFDRARQKCVWLATERQYFGPTTTSAAEFDGVTWQTFLTAVPYFASNNVSVCFDGARGSVILLESGRVSELVGGNFSLLTVNQGPIEVVQQSFETAASMVKPSGAFGVLCYLNGQTWVTSDRRVSSAVSRGQGCGYPGLSLSATSLPIVGQTQLSAVANVPLGIAFMALGFSSVSAGPFALPLDLSGFGLTGGCNLYIDASINFASPCVWQGSGMAQHLNPIPSLSGMVGVPFVMQAWAINPPANPAGIVVSNYLDCVIGNY